MVFLCLMRYEGLLTNDLYIPFVNVTLTVNWIVYLIFAAFVIVGCVNSVNLTDGIDGLASSVTAVVMAFFMVHGHDCGNSPRWAFSPPPCAAVCWASTPCITAIPPSALWEIPAACF